MTSLAKRRSIMAAIIVANCAPWLFYRLVGPPHIWPSHEPAEVWLPDGVSLDLTGIRGVFPYYFQAFCALQLAQVLLFAIWAGFGSRPLLLRLSYLLAFVAILTRTHIAEPTQPAWTAAKHVLFKFLFGYAICVAICLLVVRLAGVRFNEGKSRAAAELASPRNRRQFNLRYVFWSVVGLGFFLALWTRLITGEETTFWLRIWPLELGQYLSSAAMTVACLWLVFGTRSFLVRVAISCVAVVMACCWEYNSPWFVLDFAPADVAYRLTIHLPAAIWLSAILYVFRAVGYGLHWRMPFDVTAK